MSEIVYRIQDEIGRGPFKPGFSSQWIVPREDHENLEPWYVELGPVHTRVKRGMAAGCGCLSPEQLKRWFNKKEYETLSSLGYKAVRINVDRIIGRSRTQCFFERAEPLYKNVEIFELYTVGNN